MRNWLILAAYVLWTPSAIAQSDGSAAVHMANGIKIGEVRSNSAIVWTRLTRSAAPNANGPPFPTAKRGERQWPADKSLLDMQGAVPGIAGEVRLSYVLTPTTDPAQVTPWLAVDAPSNFTHKFALTGLMPNRTYELVVEGRANDTAPASCKVAGRFRTAPTADQPAEASFCVIACQDYPRRDDRARGHRIYGHMLGLDPDFLVHCGDTIYYDKPKPFATTVELARFKWNRFYGLELPRELHRQVSCYFLKDDHDTLKNDCWPGQRYGELTWERGLQLYREQLPVGNTPYRRVRWGRDLELWFVEGREFRSPNRDADGPEKTIWGAQQKQWLKTTMQASSATWRVLVSPTPIVGPDRQNKNDNHANRGFTHEGDEVRAFLADLGNTIVICGDRHWQYVSKDPKTGLREWSCGSASDAHAGGFREQDRSAMHEYLKVCGGFLHVRLATNDGTTRLVLRHHGTSGVMLHEDVLVPELR